MACNDYCDLEMGLNTSNPLSTTRLLARRHATYSRYHMRQSNDQISNWTTLVKGQPYYIYGKHFEYHGSDNFAVGVEI